MTASKATKTEAKKPAAKKAEHKPVKKQERKPAEKVRVKPKADSKKPEHKPAAKEAQKEDKPVEKPKAVESKAEAKHVEAAPIKKELKPKKVIEVAKITYLPSKEVSVPSKGKPRFRRQEGGRYKRLKDVWRRPTGIDSKKLERKRGKGSLPEIGYKKPSAESGLQYGFEAVRVFNVKDLGNVKPGKQAAVIAKSVGRRKRNMIIAEANRLKITILNPRRGEA